MQKETSKNTSMPFWPNPLGHRDVNLGLERVLDLLARLDNPHLKLPPIIHIAGTNGKGSTLAFVKAILEQHNLRVHCYISPHLVNFNERIIIDGKPIAEDFLNSLLNECKQQAESEPKIEVTFFEGTTIGAILAFSKIKADVILLETGMGGRLDATNVILENLCSIISPIDFDHQEFLGDSLEKIAFEKAGIIKNNCPVIVSKQEENVLAVIANQAKIKSSSMISFGKDFGINFGEKKIYWLKSSICKALNEKEKKLFLNNENNNIEFELENIGLNGPHQLINVAVAITAILQQGGIELKIAKIAQGIANTKWPARLQKIESGKFFDLIDNVPNFELFLDGSHNQQGAKTVADFLQLKKSNKIKEGKNLKIIAMVAMLQDKDSEGFFANIAGLIDELIILEIENEPKSRNKQDLIKIASKNKIKNTVADNLDEAFNLAKLMMKNQHESQDFLLIITGSLYFAGQFLQKN